MWFGSWKIKCSGFQLSDTNKHLCRLVRPVKKQTYSVIDWKNTKIRWWWWSKHQGCSCRNYANRDDADLLTRCCSLGHPRCWNPSAGVLKTVWASPVEGFQLWAWAGLGCCSWWRSSAVRAGCTPPLQNSFVDRVWWDVASLSSQGAVSSTATMVFMLLVSRTISGRREVAASSGQLSTPSQKLAARRVLGHRAGLMRTSLTKVMAPCSWACLFHPFGDFHEDLVVSPSVPPFCLLLNWSGCVRTICFQGILQITKDFSNPRFSMRSEILCEPKKTLTNVTYYCFSFARSVCKSMGQLFDAQNDFNIKSRFIDLKTLIKK